MENPLPEPAPRRPSETCRSPIPHPRASPVLSSPLHPYFHSKSIKNSTIDQAAPEIPTTIHNSIISHLVSSQRSNSLRGNPFENCETSFLKAKRAVINGFVQAQVKFGLNSRTLFMCENLLLRSLKSDFQAENILEIAPACFFLSAKFDEMNAIRFSDLNELFDLSLTREKLKQLEDSVLIQTNFELSFVSVFDALENLAHQMKIECEKVKSFALMVVQLWLFSPNIAEVLPFQLASFALVFASFLIYKQQLNGLRKYINQESKASLEERTRGLFEAVEKEGFGALERKHPESYEILKQYFEKKTREQISS